MYALVSKCLRWRGRSPVLNTAGQLSDRRNKEVSETDTIFWLVIPTPASKPPLIYKTISLWILKLVKDLEFTDLPTSWNLLTKGHILLTTAARSQASLTLVDLDLSSPGQQKPTSPTASHHSTSLGQWAMLTEDQFSSVLKWNPLNF